ncbi:unnamed protein product [Clavelina lepadiformis]|uniref:Uncharacterized protein n=2 Tax=Clavelina lepadiformis TaxID=159417 RepID=A0ABP0GA83_CLALP
MGKILYKSKRPLKIAILGAGNVGKTSIALQSITETRVDTGPTTIEDIYRKDMFVRVNDPQVVEAIEERMKNFADDSQGVLERLDRGSTTFKDEFYRTAELKVSLELIDTAGFKGPAVAKVTPRRSFFGRFSNKKVTDGTQSAQGQSQNHLSLGDLSLLARHEACMRSCDGVVLVYNVFNPNSFSVARQIRNHLIKIRTKHGAGTTPRGRPFLPKIFAGGKCCVALCVNKEVAATADPIPPIYLIGTHSDVRREYMASEKVSRMYDVSFLREPGININNATTKKKAAKSLTLGRTAIYPHDVYPVISDWRECAGFAEITSRDHNLVQQIFEQLTLAVLTT